MHVLVVYDIPGDRTRARVADACLDYGLDRIQYSAFYGRLSRPHQESLMVEISQVVGDDPANVQLIPICERDWRTRLSLEQGDDGEG
ncbi:MAG TPA: CRISPR-associated endonuclease Cas2 [Chloroflexi bacterium]|nr:CRISPR-associated endonuclease Cas2 [Chloroflexota bacterium]